MVALRDEAPPPRAPNECIRQIYRRFSSNYETLMREELDYQAPECLRDTIAAAMGERHDLAILDLGCGSGLAGVCLKPWASVIVGVDLSPEMISLARDRNIYDRLEVSEITDWLGADRGCFRPYRRLRMPQLFWRSPSGDFCCARGSIWTVSSVSLWNAASNIRSV
jgi:predicted TPR repeat methyltransferase